MGEEGAQTQQLMQRPRGKAEPTVFWRREPGMGEGKAEAGGENRGPVAQGALRRGERGGLYTCV